MLIHTGAPRNLSAEYLYAVHDARDRVVIAGCFTTPQELFTKLKPKDANLRTFGYKAWVQAPDKTERSLEATAYPGILHRATSYGKYRVMGEDGRMIHVSGHCIVQQNTFPMKKWTNTTSVNEQEIDECAGSGSEDEKYSFKKDMIK